MSTAVEIVALKNHGPETAKFQAWFEKEKRENGLIDVKFTLSPDCTSVEAFFADVNAAREAPQITDREFFDHLRR